jgi:hypothetical protein
MSEQNLSNLKYVDLHVEHIGGLCVFKSHTYIHAHFVDSMPVFTVGYETHQKKYV